jgi:integrase
MPVIENFQSFMATGLVCPSDKKKIEYSVADEPGLFVECRVSVSAAPTWYLRLKNAQGTNTYRKLGTVKELSLAQARKLVKQIRAEHVVAVSLKVTAVALVVAPQEMTLDAFMKDHFMPHCDAHIRSAKKYEILHRLHIGPKFGHLPLSQISRREVQAFHNDLLKQGQSPASADHSIKCLRRALNLAVQWEYLEKNPLKNFELFMVDNQVENYLNEEQLQRLLDVLRTDKNRTVCLILMFLLSTGARANEAMTATWKNISVESRVWKVDAIRSKSKRTRSIPLNDSALWVLEQLKTQGTSEYLFPSPVSGKPFVAVTMQWYRLCKKAEIKIRIHDLRHGFASMLVSGGRSLYEVQQILDHSDPKVTMRYAHLSSKTLQEAANAGSVIVPRVEAKAA